MDENCVNCGSGEAFFDADPYALEIGGDDTPVWLCDSCRQKFAMDI